MSAKEKATAVTVTQKTSTVKYCSKPSSKLQTKKAEQIAKRRADMQMAAEGGA